MASISVGGGQLNTSLSTSEAAIASAALQNISINKILYAAGGGTDSVPSGTAPGDTQIVLSAVNPTAATTLIGHDENLMLAGNQGADTFLMKGQGSILGGDGNDTVALWARTSKASEIVLGNGDDSINVHNLGLGTGTDLGNAFDRGFTFGNGTGDATLQTLNGGSAFWNDNAFERGTNAPPVSITLGNGNDTVYVSGLGSVTAGDGNDFFSFGKNGSISAGDGQDTVDVTGNATVNLGVGNDSVSVGGAATVNVGGGADTIQAGGSAVITAGDGNDSISVARAGQVTVGSGSDSVSLLGTGSTFNQIGAGGLDTITLGTGRDTVTVAGRATITGPTHSISATLAGGASPETLLWSNGQSVTISGGGSATIQAGTYPGDTVDGAGASSNSVTMVGGTGRDVFLFNATTPGGAYTINNFVEGSDRLQLTGYNISTVLSSDINYTGSAGNFTASINLHDGTTITLTGLHAHLTTANVT